MTGTKTFKTIDLFAGIGGVRLGFEKAGFKTVFANDYDKHTKKTYDLNFSAPELFVEDIRKISSTEIPEFDLLLGGFPCQPFSIAGYQKGLADEGRGDLFFEIVRILKDRMPIAFMLENVKNLYSHDAGNTYKLMKKALEDLGYRVKEKVLNTLEYGDVPQNRERLYIVGFINISHFDAFSFPEPEILKSKISDFLEDAVPEKYYYNSKPLFEKLKNAVVNENTVYQWRRKYVRENKNNVCPTLTANMGMGGHNVPIIKDKNGIRKLTPAECLRFQGFPLTYKLPEGVADSILYKQAGNSVSVPVIEKIALSIKSALE